MGKKLTERVTWVGKVDWELKTFHGDELSTHRGSSYNSYLIRDQKKLGPIIRKSIEGIRLAKTHF